MPATWRQSFKYRVRVIRVPELMMVAGERIPAQVHLAPLYDPKMVRIKA
jgi:hypothetical protein